MKLKNSYFQILSLSAPIIIGSAVQNVITLSDSVFLYHLDPLDFQAIGLVGVLYLMVASIGYGFSRGGQIIIARRFGEDDQENLIRSFYALVFFELILASVMFCLLQFCSAWFFELTIKDHQIIEKCLEYIKPRSYGIFFSYLGLALIALYTGIAKTKFILFDTIVLAVVNVLLNYVLIFGKFGFPMLGIAGAAWASTIAEIIAFLFFIIYMIYERNPKVQAIFKIPSFNLNLIKGVSYLSLPIVVQSIVGFGSWYIFFALIEKMGGRSLEITNLCRILYLILSIPTWGFASGANTMVSNFIGSKKLETVIPILWKIIKLNVAITWIFAIPFLFAPMFFLYPLFGSEDMSLILESKPVFNLLFAILSLFAVTGILFNGMVATGASGFGLRVQIFSTIVYLFFVYLVIILLEKDLVWAWSTELVYYLIMGTASCFYLYSKRWNSIVF